MFGDDFSPVDELRFGQKLWHVYLVTQSGTIRRTALPLAYWAYAVWLLNPFADMEPEYYDHLIRLEADRSHCGYAEAFFNVVDMTMDEEMCAKYLAAGKIEGDFDKRADAFMAEQDRRERIWREANNEWRKDLPAALD